MCIRWFFVCVSIVRSFFAVYSMVLVPLCGVVPFPVYIVVLFFCIWSYPFACLVIPLRVYCEVFFLCIL